MPENPVERVSCPKGEEIFTKDPQITNPDNLQVLITYQELLKAYCSQNCLVGCQGKLRKVEVKRQIRDLFRQLLNKP